jgi:GNS1/SUR4 family
VAYKVPVSVPYLYHLGSAVSAVASDVPSHARSVTSSVVATASAGSGAWLKKVALRAAGREGLAENVLNDRGEKFGVDAVHIVEDFIAREETRYKDELQWTHCLDTSGQVFAILLNCMYLAPLTWLFVRFFITAYLRRVERRRSSTAGERAQAARQSFQDASKGFARKVDEMHAVGDQSGEAPESFSREQLKDGAKPVKDAAMDKLQDGIEMAKKLKEDVGGATDPIEFLRNESAEQWQKTSQSPSDSAQGYGTSSTASPQADSSHASNPGSSKTLGGLGEDLRGTIRERASDAVESAKVNAGSVGETVSQIQHDIHAKGSEAVDTVKEKIDDQDEHQHNEGHPGDNLPQSGDTSGSPPKDASGNESPVNDEGETPEADLQTAPNNSGTGVEEATGAPPTEMKDTPEENGEPDRRAESETQKDQTEEEEDAESLSESDRIESHDTSEDENEVEKDSEHESSKEVEQSKADESSENPQSKADDDVDLRPSEKPQHGAQTEASSEIQCASNHSREGMPTEPTSEDDGDKVESASKAVLDGDKAEEQENETQQHAKGTSLDERLAKDAPLEQSSAEKTPGDEYLEEKAPPKTVEDQVAASDGGSEEDKTTVPKAVSTEDATEKDAGPDQSTEDVLEETTGADQGTSAQELPSTGEEGQEDRASPGTEAEHPTESDGTCREDADSKGGEQSEAEATAGQQAETTEGVDESEDEEKKAEEMSFIDFEKKVEKETEPSKTEPEETPASASETSPAKSSETKPEAEHFEGKDDSADTRKKEDDDVRGEKPKINGDTKSHDANGTSQAPLIHVDDDGAQPKQEQAGSNAPSVKSKTPSVNSKSSQSLESKHDDDGDKENQAPEQEASKHDEKDTRAEVGDDTAKVRDDLPFAEAVKE